MTVELPVVPLAGILSNEKFSTGDTPVELSDETIFARLVWFIEAPTKLALNIDPEVLV